MTAVTLPNTGLQAGFTAGESGWDDEMNRNLRVLDALVQAQVVDKDLSTPPVAPTGGQVYIVGPAPTGAWATHAGKLAIRMVGDDLTAAWTFVTPKAGWKVFVVDESAEYRYSGSAWAIVTSSFASYEADFGDGAAVEYSINHSLGTRSVHVTVIRNAVPYDEVLVDVQHTSTNEIKLVNFVVAPTLNQFKVYVSK